MKKYIISLLSNGAVLAMFIIGTKYDIPGLLQLSIFLYWTDAILGLVFVLSNKCDEDIKGIIESGNTLSPFWIVGVHGSGIVAMLVYFSYPALAAFYLFKILGCYQLSSGLRKQLDKKEDIK